MPNMLNRTKITNDVLTSEHLNACCSHSWSSRLGIFNYQNSSDELCLCPKVLATACVENIYVKFGAKLTMVAMGQKWVIICAHIDFFQKYGVDTDTENNISSVLNCQSIILITLMPDLF